MGLTNRTSPAILTRMSNFAITILSTMTGKKWMGSVPPESVIDVDPEAQLERIFRFFNRVEQADCDRLDALGYDLPSLTSGDFVEIDDQWWLCASGGWEKVNARQALTPQTDYIGALLRAPREGKYADQVRPPMFLSVAESGSLVYMHPSGEWVEIPPQGPISIHATRESAQGVSS